MPVFRLQIGGFAGVIDLLGIGTTRYQKGQHLLHRRGRATGVIAQIEHKAGRPLLHQRLIGSLELARSGVQHRVHTDVAHIAFQHPTVHADRIKGARRNLKRVRGRAPLHTQQHLGSIRQRAVHLRKCGCRHIVAVDRRNHIARLDPRFVRR